MGTRPPFPKNVEDWKAPWEVDADGNELPEDDQQLDPARLKKYLHGLLSDKERLQTSLSETTARAEAAEREIAEAADPKALEDLQTKYAAAVKERDEAKKGSSVEALKYEIALEKGLTKAQAKRLLGSSREELEQDADELLRTFGGKAKNDDPDGDDAGRARRRASATPVTRTRTPVARTRSRTPKRSGSPTWPSADEVLSA